MADLFADEDFPLDAVRELRRLGHDVLTTPESGRAGQRISDRDQLEFATVVRRAILTLNRRDFFRLHAERPDHGGIIISTPDANTTELAERIDRAIRELSSIIGRLIRIVRPNTPRHPGL